MTSGQKYITCNNINIKLLYVNISAQKKLLEAPENF
jgi:hypothetical protein